MAYQCLVLGCSGILWYANDFCNAQKDERMMAGLKQSGGKTELALPACGVKKFVW